MKNEFTFSEIWDVISKGEKIIKLENLENIPKETKGVLLEITGGEDFSLDNAVNLVDPIISKVRDAEVIWKANISEKLDKDDIKIRCLAVV